MKNTIDRPKNWLELLRLTDQALLKHSRIDVFKATGKGGQKKNKTSNAIRLTLNELSVTESGSRSKSENINNALKKLRLAIALNREEPQNQEQPIPNLPEELGPYLNTTEIHINPKNPVFPIFAATLFDSFLNHRGNWNAMSKDLGFTPSQIRRYIEKTTPLKRAFAEAESRWETATVRV